MPSCWQEALSALWIGVTGHYRLTNEDQAQEAEEQLGKVLSQLDRREEALAATKVRAGREALDLKRTGDAARCKTKLQEYKRTSVQLDRLVSYRDMVLGQMDALRNTELNKTLIAALQESSKTLKSLGIMAGVKQAEAVVSDVEASMAQAHELTSILGAPVQVTDEGLEIAMQELMASEFVDAAKPATVVPPTHTRMESGVAPAVVSPPLQYAREPPRGVRRFAAVSESEDEAAV
jgi:hypothetical protein